MIGPRTLFTKLLLLFLAFGAVMTGVYIFMMGVAHERYHLELAQTFNRSLAQEYVAANLLVEQPLTARTVSQALHQITAINPNVDLYVLDAQGRILDASTATGRRVAEDRVDVRPIEQFLTGRVRFPLLDVDPAKLRGRDVFSAARLTIPGSPARYLYVILNRREEDGRVAAQLQADYNLRQDAGVILVAALFAFAASIIFLRMLTRRLGALQRDMERFRDERLPPAESSTRREMERGDEIERLRSEFLCLAECIRGQMRELGKNDAILRELLANVSHDLRTPLATLQAQLESLTLHDNLPKEELREGLAVALSQSRRLGTLTGELLELAQLDAGQVPYSPERFQVAELLQDAVLSYGLEARRAAVALLFQPAADEVPLVLGDIALLGRVLDILLENAVRYAGADGRVTAGLDVDPQRVRVWVRNSGPGIPATERGRVFERFYRGDTSRSTQTGAAGLGLAIARGILALHGRSIDFESDPCEGTTFSFDLPVEPSEALSPVHGRVGPSRSSVG